ncbi:MAG: CHASE domain-containing protein [Candidatus Omnitrophica bacterium]|nr:CHASE domain-containing protein [Candidatus Omnitrophota bacterium]
MNVSSKIPVDGFFSGNLSATAGRRIVFMVFLVGILTTFMIFFVTRKMSLDNFRVTFKHDAIMRADLIERTLNNRIRDLDSICSFYNSSNKVERDEFRNFTASSLVDNRDIQAYYWIPYVPGPERSGYEAEAAKCGIKGFVFKEKSPDGRLIPTGQKECYYPVYFLEPDEGNEVVFGFDMGSEPTRLKTLEKARDSGEATVTGRVKLIQETEEQFGFMILRPVYRKGMPVGTVGERRKALSGFVAGVFRSGDLMKAAIENTPKMNLPSDLIDLSARDGEKLLYHWKPRLGTERIGRIFSLFYPAKTRYDCKFDFADRKWCVSVTPGPEYFKMKCSMFFWPVLPAGFSITFLLILFLYGAFTGKDRAEKMVNERTRELEETKKNLTLILDTIPERVFWKSPDSKYLGCNRPCALDAGLSSPEEIVGMTDDDLKWSRNAGQHKLDDAEVTKNCKPKLNYEEHVTNPDGSEIWVCKNKIPICDPGGKVYAILGTYEDITERKRLEKVKDEFISVVSHELRTPLAAIKESIAIVLDGIAGPVSEEQNDFLSTGKRNVDRLARLINDLLDFQKMKAGRDEMRVREYSINEIVKEVKESMTVAASKKGLDLELELSDNLPNVRFDRDKITQVLTNFVNNALKFTNEGNVKISTKRYSENALCVSVADTGVGIKHDDVHKLFQPFVQVGEAGTKRGGSTGLGLAISKSIIEKHGGKIWVDSVFGQGSVFSFILPITERRKM